MLLKLIRDTKNEELGSDFFMWEKDKDVNNCRDCQQPFTSFKRRHHCRFCGGLYCESCSQTNVEIEGNSLDRCCNYCVRGESPGDNIRGYAQRKLSTFHEVEHKINVSSLQLQWGSLFEIDSKKKPTEITAPLSGYFELVNKSPAYCALKLLFNGGRGSEVETLWEVARPSYLAVPPGEFVHVTMPEAAEFVELYVLTSNPSLVPDDLSSVIYDTKKSKNITPCAAVKNFRHCMVFRIHARGHNVLLKFKGDVIEPRLGNSIARVGVFGKLMGSSKSAGEGDQTDLDFATNINAAHVEKILCSATK